MRLSFLTNEYALATTAIVTCAIAAPLMVLVETPATPSSPPPDAASVAADQKTAAQLLSVAKELTAPSKFTPRSFHVIDIGGWKDDYKSCLPHDGIVGDGNRFVVDQTPNDNSAQCLIKKAAVLQRDLSTATNAYADDVRDHKSFRKRIMIGASIFGAVFGALGGLAIIRGRRNPMSRAEVRALTGYPPRL